MLFYRWMAYKVSTWNSLNYEIVVYPSWGSSLYVAYFYVDKRIYGNDPQ